MVHVHPLFYINLSLSEGFAANLVFFIEVLW